MKTIWHISSNRWNSAITEYALSSIRSLKGLGYKTYFTPLENSPAAQRAANYDIECLPFKSFGLRSAPKFLAEFKKIKPDLIIVYGGSEAALTALVKIIKSDVPVVRFKGEDVTIKDWGLVNQLKHNLSVK